jgi:hypothetical protein
LHATRRPRHWKLIFTGEMGDAAKIENEDGMERVLLLRVEQAVIHDGHKGNEERRKRHKNHEGPPQHKRAGPYGAGRKQRRGEGCIRP